MFPAQQGDIFWGAPTILVDRPLHAARYRGQAPTIQRNGLADVIIEGGPAPQQPRYSGTGDQDLVVSAHFGLVMLLTHDCELDKDRATFWLAPLIDLRTFGDDAITAIKELRRFRWFYLPPFEGPGKYTSWSHAAVDFGGVTTVGPRILRERAERVTSLAESVRRPLQLALLRYAGRVQPRKLKEGRTA
jgi:hypothetical protein